MQSSLSLKGKNLGISQKKPSKNHHKLKN